MLSVHVNRTWVLVHHMVVAGKRCFAVRCLCFTRTSRVYCREREGLVPIPGSDPWASREFMVKWARASYLHCTWELKADLTHVRVCGDSWGGRLRGGASRHERGRAGSVVAGGWVGLMGGCRRCSSTRDLASCPPRASAVAAAGVQAHPELHQEGGRPGGESEISAEGAAHWGTHQRMPASTHSAYLLNTSPSMLSRCSTAAPT